MGIINKIQNILTIFTYQDFVKHGRDKQETSRYFLRDLEHIKLIIIKIHEYKKNYKDIPNYTSCLPDR